MTLPVKFDPEADSEGDDAIEWYDLKRPGLGIKFQEAVRRSITLITKNPFSYPVVEGTLIRRAVVQGFPYVIIYTANDEFIHVMSIFHTSRNPIIWRGRLD